MSPSLLLPILFILLNCAEDDGGIDFVPLPPEYPYEDVTSTHLPVNDLTGLSMDAGTADFDGDGDLDIIIANEFGPNILLLNNGEGVFTNGSQNRLPITNRDSEDIGIADFDGDGDLDVVIVSEDDQINELYFNEGDGRFRDVSNRIQARGTSNAVAVADFNNDGSVDIFIGNNGQNVLLLNRGNGLFDDATLLRLPQISDVTQDVALGDVDRDGDFDILLGNEDRNRIWMNDGNGFFTDQSDVRIPLRSSDEETREVILGDVDADGDLDIFFANVEAFVQGAVRRNRLLLNNGSGVFSDETSNLPADNDQSFTARFMDIDRDGDLDIITGNTNGDNFGGITPYRVYENQGDATFNERTEAYFPRSIGGRGFDIDIADYNGDGLLDIYFSSRGSSDELVLQQVLTK